MAESILQQLTFHPVIQSWFEDSFKSVSPPQEKGWPSIRAGNHSLILAPTGSGKTLAAFLSSIDDLFRQGIEDPEFEKNPSGIHTLYISPLKALNNDIQRNLLTPLNGIQNIAKEVGIPEFEIRTMVRTGDTPPHLRQAMLKKPPHILITTPESLYLILNSEKGRQLFSNLRYVIVDEIHSITTNKRGVHLNLSLERLMPLCHKEPVRIGLSATQKPLKRIADYLGGQKWNGKEFIKRPVSIIDCGQRKKMDLKVISPIADFSELPEASVWPAVYNKLYDLITSHKTTLVFVNMRSQVEKIAHKLNEMHQKKCGDSEDQLALSHHGSMSREMRYGVEEKLKQGQIPAVIATSSLELGIDIGSIDLVIHLEAPKSVSGGLQRVGRSGHLLKATSKGRIIPLYMADLDDAVAIAACMKKGDIEEISIPQNCLDVLAQQIVAEIAARTWQREALYRQYKQSYCYQNLSQNSFDQVLEMLTGRYAETKIPALQPVINWDRVNDRLIALPGSRLLSNLNGGTIPDRGYYGVYLAETNTRLGEMEEEFVFESRVGDIFYLGNTEWRINTIIQDRIIVTPAVSVTPRAPFWKGEFGYQNATTAEKVGAFRETLTDELKRSDSIKTLADKYDTDEPILTNLIKYFKKQINATQHIPTHSQIIAEYFHDAAGELHLVIHAPFGGRVNAAWAIVIAALLEERLKSEVQYSFDDDGFILRLRGTTEIPDIEPLFQISSTEISRILTDKLATSPVFAIQFRYSAARALLLARSRPGKRIPLWLQRLRATDLYQSIQKYPDFPILVETYRTCLEDVFDLNALLGIIHRINGGQIQINVVQTSSPSPMVSGLIFDFVSSQVYEQDRTRAPGQVAMVSNDLLTEILSRDTIPAIITQEIIAESRARWQSLHPEKQARDIEQLHLIIKKLSPLENEDLKIRSRQEPDPWLQSLHADGRICKVPNPYQGWIATEDISLFSEPRSKATKLLFLRRFLENEGPISISMIRKKLIIPETVLKVLLEELYQEKVVVKGLLIKNDWDLYWCNRDNFAELYRRAIGRQRRQTTAVDRPTYYRFLLHWHHLVGKSTTATNLFKQYSGLQFQPNYLERELWRRRFNRYSDRLTAVETSQRDVSTYQNLDSEEIDEVFKTTVRNGQIILLSPREKDTKNTFYFIERGQGNLFHSLLQNEEKDLNEDKDSEFILSFLKQNGSSPYADIELGTGISGTILNQTLQKLLLAGDITTDNYAVFIRNIETNPHVQKISLKRHQVKQKVQNQLLIKEGQWFLTSSFAVMGKAMTDQERIEQQARLLLKRHGILVKEWYRREKGFAPWYQIFQALKRLEWQGEILRGYFIEGLSGIQYALPEAVELLKVLPDTKKSPRSVLINTSDPALPFGGNVDWDLKDSSGESISITRLPGNHLLFIAEQPKVYSENYGRKLYTLQGFDANESRTVAEALKDWLRLPPNFRPVKKIVISEIDRIPAIKSSLAKKILDCGYELDGKNIVLWPSGV